MGEELALERGLPLLLEEKQAWRVEEGDGRGNLGRRGEVWEMRKEEVKRGEGKEKARDEV